MRIKNPAFPAVAALLVALLWGCSSAPPVPKVYDYSIRGHGDQILNRDTNGNSLSVVVRIYQLKDAQEFSKLTFDAVASGRPESDFLGPALLAKTDAVIIPGGSYENSEKLLDDTRYVGIVAFFRKPDAYYWRQLADAEVVRTQGLAFTVQDCFVMLHGDKFVPLPGQPASQQPDCGTVSSVAPSSARSESGNAPSIAVPSTNNANAPR